VVGRGNRVALSAASPLIGRRGREHGNRKQGKRAGVEERVRGRRRIPGDIRKREFLRAMIIEDHSTAGGPITVSIHCEFKSWTRFLTLDSIRSLELLSADEIAGAIATGYKAAYPAL
jgi:hypothetical protein